MQCNHYYVKSTFITAITGNISSTVSVRENFYHQLLARPIAAQLRAGTTPNTEYLYNPAHNIISCIFNR